jgi:U11-48K-like CHHC zinc finger
MVKNCKVRCPYNRKHKMKYTRLIYHIAKGCPDMVDTDLDICIYNWVHRVPKGSLESHYLQCEFKPQLVESLWNQNLDMEIWNTGTWNFFLYDKAWPPDFFPDY